MYTNTLSCMHTWTHTQIPGGNRDMFGINDYMSGS